MDFRSTAFVITALAAITQSVSAETLPVKGKVITMTRVTAPWYAPKFLIKSGMKKSIPEYAAVKGLVRKVYSIEEGTGFFGGIYLWENEQSAKEWFNQAWFDRVNSKYGGDHKVPIRKAIYAYTLDSELSEEVKERWVDVKSYQIGTEGTTNLPTYFQSKMEGLKNQPGFLSFWVAEESPTAIQIFSVWQDRSSLEKSSRLDLIKPTWKLEENILTQSPILLKNDLRN